MRTAIPEPRVAPVNQAPVRAGGDYVLYWMTAARRTTSSYALDRALEWARGLKKPLLVLEALRCDYPWASDRLHAFVLCGMRDNQRRCEAAGVAYYPYVEPARGAGKGLLAALAARACVVVADDFPCFFLPRMVAAAGAAMDVLLERVDGNGLVPTRASEGRVFPTAFAFRRYLQKLGRGHFSEHPSADPFARLALPRAALPEEIVRRWPPAPAALLAGEAAALAALPIDHAVGPAEAGGSEAAARRLKRFLASGLKLYAEERNQPEREATSGLSPFLHFGHIGAHEVFAAVMKRERWTPERLPKTAAGKREGWWQVGADAEGFLDQLVTWRELGFNYCAHRDDYDQYDSLPGWARQTLAKHADDPRPALYDDDRLAEGRTADPLWNAAQLQLVREGRIHNYLRMLWGKKLLEWSPTPQDALRRLIALNDRYALDGRDPNSYSGIFWTLGRYDRPWGPERPVYGTVRYMSSENTARKVRVKEYLRRHAP